jgi:hypothetical protein
MIRALLVVSLLGGIARAQPAESADTIRIRAKQNDSVSMLASEYYGDRNKFPYIIAENRLKPPRPLQQGQWLRIPMIREIVTVPGDDFYKLAHKLLGDDKRASFLSEANQMSKDDSLPAGTSLLVPFTITHTADKPESLAQIAAIYYSEPKLGDLLRAYNFLDKNVLEKGESVIVPSVHVKVNPDRLKPLDAESRSRRDRRREQVKLAAAAIPVARHAWRIGDYAVVKKQLAELDVAYLDLAQAVDVGVLLGSAQVALGEAGASQTFQRVLARKPGHALRKLDLPPKVLAVWSKVNGKVE